MSRQDDYNRGVTDGADIASGLIGVVVDATLGERVKAQDAELVTLRARLTALEQLEDRVWRVLRQGDHDRYREGKWDLDHAVAHAFTALEAETQTLRQERDEARGLNVFFRNSVGECHVMISRDTPEYQIDHEWPDPCHLPPRLQKVMRRMKAAEAALAAYKADRATLQRLEEWANRRELPGNVGALAGNGYTEARAEVRRILKGEAGS